MQEIACKARDQFDPWEDPLERKWQPSNIRDQVRSWEDPLEKGSKLDMT